MITATPTSYEIYDDDAQQALAKIVMFDEGASNVEITTVVDPALWIELSAVILDALKQMHPGKPPLIDPAKEAAAKALRERNPL